MQFITLFVIIAILAIGIPIYLKKRKGKTVNSSISTRHNKDEVWRTIKQYLKDVNEYGKEIVDSYVAKRNGIDFINPNDSRFVKRKKRYEIKIRDWQFKQKKITNKKSGTKTNFKNPKERDLYVVCFTTRQTKTLHDDPPRAIECEVINTKVSKKDWDRKILINGLLNFDREMEWIAPLKSQEQAKSAKAEKQQRRLDIKQRKKAEKAKVKSRAKMQKIKEKSQKAK